MISSTTPPKNTEKYNEDFLAVMKSIYETGQELTAIPIQQYQTLFYELMRDEIQMVLPRDPNDMFSEELRVLISNVQVTSSLQRIDMSVLNADAEQLSKIELNGEKVLLMTANKDFYALYTNKQQLHIFSSSTTEVIKRGILLEGVCMIQTNQSLRQLAMLTMKGNIYVFEVNNPDYTVQETVKKVLQTSIQDILKNSQLSMAAENLNNELIHVQSISLCDNGEI